MICVWKSKSGSEWISKTKPVKEEGKKFIINRPYFELPIGSILKLTCKYKL